MDPDRYFSGLFLIEIGLQQANNFVGFSKVVSIKRICW